MPEFKVNVDGKEYDKVSYGELLEDGSFYVFFNGKDTTLKDFETIIIKRSE